MQVIANKQAHRVFASAKPRRSESVYVSPRKGETPKAWINRPIVALLLAPLFLASCAGLPLGHVPLEIEKDAIGREFFSVSVVDDVDGDGGQDIVVGMTKLEGGHLSHDSGNAFIVSGSSGQVIHVFECPPGETSFGYSVVGITGGSQPEGVGILIGSMSPPAERRLSFYSQESVRASVRAGRKTAHGDRQLLKGVAASLMAKHPLGRHIWAVGFSRYFDTPGEISVVDTSSDELLWTLAASTRGIDDNGLDRLISDNVDQIQVIEDVNEDGFPDLAVSTSSLGSDGDRGLKANGGAEGAVFLLSGADGELLAFQDGAVALDHFGSVMTPHSDSDADGVGDLLVSAPGKYTRLLSGLDLLTLWEWNCDSNQAYTLGYGGSIATGRDLNGDGIDEVYVGGKYNPPGWAEEYSYVPIYCLNGRDGVEIFSCLIDSHSAQVVGRIDALRKRGAAILVLDGTNSVLQAWSEDLSQLRWSVDLHSSASGLLESGPLL